MPQKKSFIKSVIPGSPVTGVFSFSSKPLAMAAGTFILLTFLFGILIYQRYEILREDKLKEAFEIVNNAKDKLQETLAKSLSATKILSFFIDQTGKVQDFDSVAEQILESDMEIDAVQLVPDGVIQFVYPLKGNEKVIGYNILKDSARNKEAYKAIEMNEMFFAGPFELKQGGIGVVGRLPVYRNNRFWGFSAVVIKMATLLKAAGIDNTDTGEFYFQLSKINPDTKKEEFFLPLYKGKANSQSASIRVPDGEWKLSVVRVKEYTGFGNIALLALLSFLLSLSGAVFAYRLANRPNMLNRLVKEQTIDLRKSENKYRSVIERVSDAFVSLDKEWKYTYLNKKAGEIFARDTQELIGKNIWNEFPEGIDQPFYHAYYKAMETQEYQYLEEYYPPYNKWFENHIYPSADGLTIFFKDVTEVKQISLALTENEEKYRSLIEQASDGIVITNMDGIILEVNDSIMNMVDYAEEEMIGHHLTEYLPEEDLATAPLRINELMQGKSLLYERKILKKDGSILEVEINSKMASSHSLIGFIRDITERKKNEKTLQYQARLIEGVSDAIVSLDTNRCIVSWNNACEELFGLKTEEVLGRRIPELMSFNYPNTDNEAVFKQVFQTGIWRGEFDFMHPKTNDKIHLLSSISVLKDRESEITGFIITSKDITKRKVFEDALQKSNERFELIAEATNDVIWDHDFISNTTWGNKSLYKLYGIKPGDASINFEMFINQIHPDERGVIRDGLDHAIKNQLSSVNEAFRFKTANGEFRFFYDRAYIKYDDAGKPVRILGAMQDITESERVKKAIQESEEKFRAIIEQASDGIFLADENTFFVDVNTAGCRMTGFTLAELKTKNFLDIIPPEDLVKIPVRITSMENGASLTNERRILRKDGTIIDVEISAKKLLDGRYQSIARDITERKKIYKALRESEERYRVLVENATEALVVLDFESQKFVSVSDSASRLFGISKEELLKLGPAELSPEYQPDGRLSADAAKDYIIKAVNGEKPSFEWTHETGSGNIIQCELWLVRLPSDDKVLIRGTIVNITERKKAEEALQLSEQKYRLLFYNNPLSMWMTTLPGLDIIDVNDAAIKQYGYSREEFLKLNTRQLRPEEDLENFLKEVDKMEPGIINVRPWRHKKKDGTVIQVETYSHQIMYEGQRAWLGLSHDVTEKNEAKELLQKSYEDIRQLASNLQSIREDERTNIAREIHDELGQQLTGLKMDLHWLMKKINSTDTEINDKMAESIELINATITSVRKISTDLRPSILDDLGLIAALEWQGEEFEKRSGTQVKFTNEAGDLVIKPEITTTIFRIYQELLTNIARHANASQVTAILKKENDKLILKITDNGSGFNLETINNKKTLGLLGIKERTLLLGGTYEFKSKPGKGSETIISIPLINA